MTDNTNKIENVAKRPPIVVILGHVDHGKTKLLDFIRKTKVIDGEAGGITQHIGAYQASIANGTEEEGIITFLDTPGHAAFSAIRSRGTNVADIGILVIAADEGIKPQTQEAISILQKSEIPFVIAINKVDKPEANSQKIKQQLADENILIEEWGGKIPAIDVSAETGQGVDQLLEMINLMAEMEELSADSSKPAEGVVIESHLDNKRGNLATLLVLDGTLRLNDWVVAGTAISRVKGMEDFKVDSLKEALPSQPVAVMGWDKAPDLGENFKVVKSKKEAEAEAQKNIKENPEKLFFREDTPMFGPTKKTVFVVIRADVHSSLEAIDQALKTITSEEVEFRVLEHGVGNISDGDIKKASPKKATVIGFHVEFDNQARDLAEREGVEIKTFDIIYELVEFIREKMEDMLDPDIVKNPLGKLKVLAVFKRDERGQIVGGKVVSGKLKRGAMIDLVREKKVVLSGKLTQLQQSKADVEEVKEGFECGIRFEPNKADGPSVPIRVGDVLEIYEEQKIKKSLA